MREHFVWVTTRRIKPGALEEFDEWLPGFRAAMQPHDLAIFTADHGCDPTTPSTDHSREYTPLLVFGPQAKPGVDLGLRATLSVCHEAPA